MTKKISVIVPCYNEEAVIKNFYKEITRVLSEEVKTQNYEVIFVNDGSRDSTHQIISELSERDEHIHFVSFSRNFGKESAMYAGLEYADGDYSIIMDADLQHPP